MEVKVECPCGQRYKFDVEPVNGRMPTPVSCPVCALDGTAASEAIIQQRLGAPAPAPASQVRIVAPGAPAASALRIAHAAPQVAPAHQLVENPAPASVAPTASVRPVPRALSQAAQPAPGAARVKGKFSHGIAGAVLGTLLGVGLWLGIFYATEWGSKSFMKIFAVAVGFAGGMGARWFSKDEGSKDLGYITAAIAFTGIFAAQYLIAREQIIGGYKRIVGNVYEERVEYAKAAVKAVPTGSEKEIREFLAKDTAEEGERIKPAEISAEDVQEFRENELPKLRDLASGKVTKAQHNKAFGTDELEENSGVKLLIAIKGIGLFSFGIMIVAVGTAFKMSATDA